MHRKREAPLISHPIRNRYLATVPAICRLASTILYLARLNASQSGDLSEETPPQDSELPGKPPSGPPVLPPAIQPPAAQPPGPAANLSGTIRSHSFQNSFPKTAPDFPSGP